MMSCVRRMLKGKSMRNTVVRSTISCLFDTYDSIVIDVDNGAYNSDDLESIDPPTLYLIISD